MKKMQISEKSTLRVTTHILPYQFFTTFAYLNSHTL